MRRTRTLGILAVTCCAAGVMTMPAATAAGGFTGSWTATDTLDGSSLSLSIRGSGSAGHYAVREVDAQGTVCGGAPTLLAGSGALDGAVLVAPVTLACLPGGNIIRRRIAISFTYDATSDTLTDNDGVIWTRAH